MHRSVDYWLSVRFRSTEDNRELLRMAMDATAADDLSRELRNLRRRWSRKFDRLADDLAAYFTKRSVDRTDAELKKMLRRSGTAVEFRLTRPMREAVSAIVAENISLIRSVPEQYLKDVEGATMRSVLAGRDLAQLTRDLEQATGVARRRAELIARDQNNKASGALQRVRYQELGIERAVWVHSRAGRDKRPSHVANDGNEYDVATGWYDPDEGAWIRPGELINCFPGSTTVGSNSPIRHIWKSMFKGDMVNLVVGPDLIQATPNHPILTQRGWLPAYVIEKSDNLVAVVSHDDVAIADEECKSKPTFDDLFEACAILFGNVSARGVGFNFYGDVPDGEVYDVAINHDLLFKLDASLRENPGKGILSLPRIVDQVLDSDVSRLRDVLSTLLGRSGRGHYAVSVGCTSEMYSGTSKHSLDDYSCRSEFSARSGSSVAEKIVANNRILDILGERALVPTSLWFGHNESTLAQLRTDNISVVSYGARGILQGSTVRYELLRVDDKFIRDSSRHVFTMQTDLGYYTVGASNAVAKNCRCFARPVLP